jgi:hypothetical protein
MSLSVIIAVLGAITVSMFARREHAKAVGARRPLLDHCAKQLADAKIGFAQDGYPRLEGVYRDQKLRVELIPDSMTVRRLPQLWLQLTYLEKRPNAAEYSVLVRPTGAEFYSLTNELPITLKPPRTLELEMLAKGSTAFSQQALDASAPTLARLFADPRMKEIAITRRGIRFVWQAAEGSRGDHLFRQCRFEDAAIDPHDFSMLLRKLDDFRTSLNRDREALVS